MNAGTLLYVGLKAHVVALDKATGAEVWRTELKRPMKMGDRFVSLLVDDDKVYAHTKGEIYCLDAAAGTVLWSNPLKDLSYDIATLATQGAGNALPVYHRKKQIEASGAAGDGGGSGGA
jgi:outer membrane protein assembly factor BamB